MTKNIAILNALGKIHGAQPVGLEVLTDAKARKTGNPFGTIWKKSRFVSFVGANYENSVNREAEKQWVEGGFRTGSLPWGEWVNGFEGKVIFHNGKFYLRTQSRPGERKARPAKVVYQNENGKKVPFEDIKPFLPEKRESARQQFHGLNETVHVRTFSFESILKLRVGGKTLNFGQQNVTLKPRTSKRTNSKRISFIKFKQFQFHRFLRKVTRISIIPVLGKISKKILCFTNP